MNRLHLTIKLFILNLLLAGFSINPVVAVPSSVGVNDGDSFDFVIENLINTDPSKIGYILGFDNDGSVIYTTKTLEFSVSFVNSTPYEIGFDRFAINFEVTVYDEKYSNYALLNTFTGILSTTDWDTIILPQLETDINEINADINDNETKIGSVTLINSNSEVGMIGGFKVTGVQNNMKIESSWEIDIRKEKSTGVLLYQKEIETMIISSENQTRTEIEELLVKRKGYSFPNNASGFVPGFRIPILFTSLSLMIITIHNRRKSA